jgi:hypothetical protein
LVTFAARLRVIDRAQTIAELLDLLEFCLIGLMSGVVHHTVALIVESGGRFRWLSRGGSEDETEESQREKGSHRDASFECDEFVAPALGLGTWVYSFTKTNAGLGAPGQRAKICPRQRPPSLW